LGKRLRDFVGISIVHEIAKKFLHQPRSPIHFGCGYMEICLKFHLKFGIHCILRQNVTNHQILMQISIVSTNGHSCQHIVVDWELFCDQEFHMAATKPVVVSNLEVNSTAEKLSGISPILLDIYVAGVITEHTIHDGTCKIQNGGKNQK
jgi:hypothetical protein